MDLWMYMLAKIDADDGVANKQVDDEVFGRY